MSQHTNYHQASFSWWPGWRFSPVYLWWCEHLAYSFIHLFFSLTLCPCFPSPSVLFVCLWVAAVCSSVGGHAGISGVQARHRAPAEPGSRNALAYQWPEWEEQEQPSSQDQGTAQVYVLPWLYITLHAFVLSCTLYICIRCVCVHKGNVFVSWQKKKKSKSPPLHDWHVCHQRLVSF